MTQILVSVVMMILAIAGMVVAPINRLSTAVESLQTTQRLTDARLNAIEEKDRAYDALIQQRNQQMTDVQIRMARMEEKIDNLLLRRER